MLIQFKVRNKGVSNTAWNFTRWASRVGGRTQVNFESINCFVVRHAQNTDTRDSFFIRQPCLGILLADTLHCALPRFGAEGRILEYLRPDGKSQVTIGESNISYIDGPDQAR